jgi:hypothetical protein
LLSDLKDWRDPLLAMGYLCLRFGLTRLLHIRTGFEPAFMLTAVGKWAEPLNSQPKRAPGIFAAIAAALTGASTR